MENKKSNWLRNTTLILCGICLAMLIFYFINVSTHFSTDSNEWGNFGDYLGSVTGILAFAGVLYSINISEKRADKADERTLEAEKKVQGRFKEESDRNIFFQLLDLHIKKTESIIFEDKDISTGVIAFRDYTKSISISLNSYLIDNYIINSNYIYSDFPLERNLFNTILRKSAKRNVDYYITDISNDIYIELKEHLLKKRDEMYLYEKYMPIEEHINFCLNGTNINEKYILFKFIGALTYYYYGHILGPYFRNMFYVMDTISKFSNQMNYKELFRAQLSRYELVLALFNAVSSHSSLRMVELLEEFDVFKDVYPDDLYILKKSDNPQQLIKDILNEYKNDVANKQLTKS